MVSTEKLNNPAKQQYPGGYVWEDDGVPMLKVTLQKANASDVPSER